MNFKESDTVELKKSLSQLEDSLRTVCAFLNHKGGVIYFGIQKDGCIVGQEATDSNLRRISQQITSRIKPTSVPCIEEIEINKKPVIKVTIPKSEKELHYFDGVPYKKSGSETIVMPPQEIKSSILRTSGFEWDKQICESASLEDIDEIKVKAYLKYRAASRNIPSVLNMSLTDFLVNIKAVSEGKPTHAGILFFGNDPLKYIRNAQIRIARIKGFEIFNDIIDRLDCEGTLWEMVLQAEDFIKRNIRLAGLRTEKFQRVDRYEYPIRALREAIINAVIHRDYLSNADVRIFLFDDRMEIINPGGFPEGVSPEKPFHKPVNAVLSNYMYDIGFIEKYGSGIYLESKLCEENGNKPPIYELHDIETKVIFKSQVKIVTVDLQKMRHQLVLNDRQQKTVEYLIERGKITTKEYVSLHDISLASAKRDLLEMKKKHVIRFMGSAKTGFYILYDTVNDTVNDTVK